MLRFRPSRLATIAAWTLLLLAAVGTKVLAWTPGTSSPNAAQGFVVDPSNRTDVLSFFNTIYAASGNFASRLNWTGNLSTGQEGTTGASFKEDVRRRINFYRALGGLPADITFNSAENAKCQEAALMFSANNSISHTPPSSWRFYTANAAEAAGKSNLALGNYGPDAVDGFMEDDGSNNALVGHRRWLMYSLAREMATGDVPPTGSNPAANAIWVIGNFKSTAPKAFVAWPNKGFLPIDLLPARWSLSYPGANFGSASVGMTRNGTAISTTIISRTDNGYGDNTLVWEPSGLSFSETNDTVYRVTVSGIGGAGVPTSTTYTVTTFDSGNLGQSAVISGPAAPPDGTQIYTFNSITQADRYEVRASLASSGNWSEGAENTATILDQTASSYSLAQNAVVASGSQAFHLTFPDFSSGDQGLEVNRDIVPSGSSQLIFRDLFRWATTGSRLSAEISVDGGSSWTEIWGRNGNGNNSSSGWDSAFNFRSISLAAYAGKPTRVRFVYRFSGSTFLGTDTSTGVFLDDVSISGARELVNTVTSTLPAGGTSFSLSAALGNASPIAGADYYLRIRPNVGTRWFGDGPLKVVTPQSGTGTPPPPDVGSNPIAQPPGVGQPSREIVLWGNLDFGSKRLRSLTSRRLFIKNTGTLPLQVYRLRLPAGFTAKFSGIIPPGARRSVPVTFIPRNRRSYAGVLTVACNATDGARTINLTATGR